MAEQNQSRLFELMASLSEEQQSAVEAFIQYLREKDSSGSSADVQTALDEFVRDHSELLRRLSQ